MSRSHFIDNVWKSGDGPSFLSANPATEEVLWKGHEATVSEIDEAVTAAEAASKSWARLSVDERYAYCLAFKDVLTAQAGALAEAISKEMGKPLWEAKNEVATCQAKIAISLEAQRARAGERTVTAGQAQTVVRHRPHGVVAVLGPFNFPAHLPNGHIVPALIAGNTIVFKPSEFTPHVGQLYVECWQAAGLPPGVLNLVQGGRETGKLLSHHPTIRGLYFTGSAQAGKALSQHFGEHYDKILALELGGNNPLIVSDIEDVEAAAYVALQSAYLTAGQRCSCARRIILVDSPKAATFVDALLQRIRNVDVPAFMGSLIHQRARDQVLAGQKARVALGGKILAECQPVGDKGAFCSPGLIDMTDVLHKPDEEIFGPFSQLIRVPTFEAALEEANRTRFGLTASVLTKSRIQFDEALLTLRAGVVNWNMPTTGASSACPYGGCGASGNHRPSAYYAADYCNYPVASSEELHCKLPAQLLPGT